jgi:hypothetical protein
MAQDSALATMRLPNDDEMETLQKLVDHQLYCEAELERAEEALKEAKSNLAKVQEFDLPNAFEQFGITKIKMKSGAEVTIKSDVYAGITKENSEQAFAWLEATGRDGIIKNEIKCPFSKGEDAVADTLTALLDANGFTFMRSRSVHPSTLKSFVKSEMEQGTTFPPDLFSIHPKQVAVITLPKVKSGR